MSLRDISVIWVLIHCIIMFSLLYESKYPFKKANIITAAFVIPLITLNMASVFFLGDDMAMKLCVLTCVIPSFVFFFFMAKHRNMKFVFTFCLVDTIILWILLLTRILDEICGLGNCIVMLISRIIITLVLEWLIVRYFRSPYHEFQHKIKKGWGIFAGLSIFFYVILIVTISFPVIIYERPEYYPHITLFLFFMPMMYVTVFYVLWSQLKLNETEKENKMLTLYKKAADEKISDNEQMEGQLKILRHDIRHHILLLKDYIRNNDFRTADRYLDSIISVINKTTPHNFCANHSINVILTYYNTTAMKENISFKTQINLPPQLSVNETDVAVILSNGIENAVNAVKKETEKIIIVNAFIDNDKIYIEIKNTFTGNITIKNKLPVTSSEEHGYGTRSMAHLVNTNNGIFSFTAENGEFIFRCAI